MASASYSQGFKGVAWVGRVVAAFRVGVALIVGVLSAAPHGGLDAIRTQEIKEWLTYISSDELQGRAVLGAGIGLATAYLADHVGSDRISSGLHDIKGLRTRRCRGR